MNALKRWISLCLALACLVSLTLPGLAEGQAETAVGRRSVAALAQASASGQRINRITLSARSRSVTRGGVYTFKVKLSPKLSEALLNDLAISWDPATAFDPEKSTLAVGGTARNPYLELKLLCSGQPGRAKILVQSKARPNRVKKSLTVTIKPTEVESLALTESTKVLKDGEKYQLKYTIKTADPGQRVFWKSSNASVATVDEGGVVTAKKPGKATITLTAGNKSAKCRLTVTRVAVESVQLSKTELALGVGQKEMLVAQVLPAGATNQLVTWKSSKRSVATVSSNGRVTAKKPGTAVITATSKDGKKKASCTVTVTAQKQQKTYRALLIGNQNYADGELKGPIQDAKNMEQTLKRSNIAGQTYTRVERRSDLTGQQMLAALEDMQNWGIGENDVTLFYYSGHGTQRPGDASDTGTALVGVDSVCPTIKSVQERLDKLPGTVIVILDSCFSGQFIGKAAGEQVTQAEVERFNRSVVSAFSSIQAKNLTGPKYQVITASRGHELSNSAGFLPDGATDESQVVMLGIASYYLSVAGGYDYFAPGSTKLRGDANRDRLVSMKEACAYAEKRVKSWREYINQVWGPNQEDGMQDYPYTTQSVQVWPANSSYPLFGRTTK